MSRGKRHSLVVGLVFLVAVLAVAGCSSGTTTGGTGTKTIIEKGFAFNPTSLSVAVGDTVTFLNEDSVPHLAALAAIAGVAVGALLPGV